MYEEYAWLIWLGVALVLVAIEAATVDLTFLMLGGAALAASLAAALGAPFGLQAIVAAVAAIGLLFMVRPWLKRRLSVNAPERMGAQANLGRSAFVLDRVTSSGGQIKLAGETWSARTLGESIEPGEEVVVDSIDGATAVVSRARVIGS